MRNFICTTCGTQFEKLEIPPDVCPVCDDERQYVNWGGQKWTTLEEMKKEYKSIFKVEEKNLLGIGTKPEFGIGQRALLIQTPKGNVLWDCITFIDDETISKIKSLGGINAIAISHPHYYSAMIEWSKAFNNAPIYLHANDSEWVMRHDDAIIFWEGESFPLFEGITLINCGGHFKGSSVLLWENGAEGRGALFTGDTIQVVMDRRYVSFMYSYPNLIPLSADGVQKIVESVAPFKFDRIYGAWFGKVVFFDAENAVTRSAERYINAIEQKV